MANKKFVVQIQGSEGIDLVEIKASHKEAVKNARDRFMARGHTMGFSRELYIGDFIRYVNEHEAGMKAKKLPRDFSMSLIY